MGVLKTDFRLPLLLVFFIMLLTQGCMPKVASRGESTKTPYLDENNFIASDGIRLPYRKWIPSDGRITAAVVALHGFNDYSNAFEIPSRYLVSKEIAVYAYDQRGFGRSPFTGLWGGIEAYCSDLKEFTLLVRRKHPSIPVYILGESMGGAVAIVSASFGNPPEADGLILVAPAVWGRETMPWYQRWALALTAYTVPWMTLTGSGLGVIPSDNIEMRKGLSKDPLVIKDTRIDSVYGLTNLMDEALHSASLVKLPVFVLYGEKDQVIPEEPTLRMISSMTTSVEKAFYPEGYHMLLRDLGREKPLSDIVKWILKSKNEAAANGRS